MLDNGGATEMKYLLLIIHLATGNMTTIPHEDESTCLIARYNVLEIVKVEGERNSNGRLDQWTNPRTAKSLDAICIFTGPRDLILR